MAAGLHRRHYHADVAYSTSTANDGNRGVARGGDDLNQVVRGRHRAPVDADAQRLIDSKRLN